MRAMKDSGVAWLGMIPVSWDIKPIGSGFTEVKNKNINNFPLDPLQFRYGKIVKKEKVWSGEEAEDTYSAYNIVSPDMIMINGLNLEFDFITQRVALVTEEGIITSTYLALKTSSNVYPSYANYLLKAYDACKVFHSLGRGLRKTLTFSELKKQPMLFLDYEEQKRIVAFLDAKCAQIDAIIEKQQQVIEKLKAYKQSVITEAVTKGLDPSVPMKDSGVEWIGQISSAFTIFKLKYILKSRLQYGANESGVAFSEDLPRYIRITDITPDGDLKEDGKLSLPHETASEYLLEDGDILFARSGATVGKTFIYNKTYGTCAFAGYLIRAVVGEKALARFVYYFTLSSVYESWKNGIFIQATIQNIGAEKYSNMQIPIPSIEQQSEIVEHLDRRCTKIDSVIKSKRTVIDKLTDYKKSLIYEAVTGKMEV